MGMQKHNWTSYSRQNEIVEIILRDQTGAKVDSFKCNSTDVKARRSIARIMHEKYGIDFTPEIDVEQSINAEKKAQVSEEYNWLK